MPLFALLLLSAAPLASPVPGPEKLSLGSDLSERMTLPARINGRGPFAFTVDTGADHSVVSDTLASELALPPAGAATLAGIEGESAISLVQLDSLRVGQREHRALSAPVLPQVALGAQGFIGLDALAGESMVLDFVHNDIIIARSPHEALADDPDVIVVTARSRFGQLILTDFYIGRTKVRAIIDTGAQYTLGNLALRTLLGRTGPLDDRGNRVIGVTGAALPVETGALPRVHLASLIIGPMPIYFADVDTFRRFQVDDKPAVLIGMDMLRLFKRVALDFRQRSVRFQLGDFARAPIQAQAANIPKGTRAPLGI